MRRVVLLLSAALAAQDPAKSIERAFRPGTESAETFTERMAALAGVHDVAEPRVLEVLLRAWKGVHEAARQIERKRVRPAAQKMPSVTELNERVELNDYLRLLSTIEDRMRQASGAALAPALTELLEPRLPLQARAALLDVVPRLGAAEVARLREGLRRARRSEDVWIALRALAALGKSAQAAGGEVEALLPHREAIVRTQAAATIAALEHRAGTPALIARLDGDDLREQQAVVTALTRLTGQRFGAMQASWRGWWEAEGASFVQGEPSEQRRRPPAPRDAKATRSAYFGIPFDGRSVLYLVDFSLSMQHKAGAGESLTRWQACTRELGSAIDRLQPGQSFNIVVFAQRVLAWSDKAMPADARNATAAKAWLDDLELELGTSIFEAFEVAFALAGVRVDDRAYAPAIDTIYFLSDGLPTIRLPSKPGKLGPDDPELVRALVRRHNPMGAIVVHAIMLGRAGGGPFMAKLAAENGGQFVKK
ncbi:MAG: hypothetical protein R3F56_09600 [Planctomycetota bacterium]